jgi:RNA polymerase sigma factor (sigma-70 family)
VEFHRFAEAHRSRWVRSADGVLRNRADAEDVVQETLAAVWARWPTDRPADPTAYVSRAVRLNALRRRARRRRSAPLDEAVHVADPSPDGDLPLDPVDLELALADLPPAQQAVIRAKFYLGLTFEQVGRQLSISSNTAASRCRYALATLRKRFGSQSSTQRSVSHD